MKARKRIRIYLFIRLIKIWCHIHTQGAEVTGQLRVNGKLRHLGRCTLEDQSLALKRKHRVHKYVNTAIIFVYVIKLFILT